MAIRIYLATGEEQEVEGDGELELVGITNDGSRALTDIMDLKPDVAVLGMAMQELTGIQVVAALKAEGYTTKVLFSGPNTKEAMLAAMTAGANGYLFPDTNWGELRGAIRRVAHGDFVVPPEVVPTLIHEIQLLQAEVLSGLTVQETAVLRLLAEEKYGSVSAVAEHLDLGESTVRKYMRGACTKLAVTSWTAAVAEGVRRGLVD